MSQVMAVGFARPPLLSVNDVITGNQTVELVKMLEKRRFIRGVHGVVDAQGSGRAGAAGGASGCSSTTGELHLDQGYLDERGLPRTTRSS